MRATHETTVLTKTQMAEDLRRLKRENERLKRENEMPLTASALFTSRQL